MSYSEAVFSAEQQALLRQAEAAPAELAVQVLGRLAGTFWRAGRLPEFADCFRRLYILQPQGALARFMQAMPAPADSLRDVARALLQQDVAYAAILADLAVAETNPAAVRTLIDYDRFFHHDPGAADDDRAEADFHAALAAEIRAKMAFYAQPAGRAIQQGWRHNNVLNAGTPALTRLRERLAAQVARYVAALPRTEHPFLKAAPPDPGPKGWDLNGWAVVSSADSYHKPHIHPRAWLTGVYYVRQPAVSRDAEARVGWLRIGAPSQVGDDSVARGWDTRWIAPRPGTLILMPAYFYHETQPMGVPDERICIAFEVSHPELASPRGGEDMGR